MATRDGGWRRAPPEFLRCPAPFARPSSRYLLGFVIASFGLILWAFACWSGRDQGAWPGAVPQHIFPGRLAETGAVSDLPSEGARPGDGPYEGATDR